MIENSVLRSRLLFVDFLSLAKAVKFEVILPLSSQESAG